MKVCKCMISPSAFIVLALVAFGQTTSGLKRPITTIPTKQTQGVVVEEEVNKDSIARTSKFQEGDILLNWSRGDVKGAIASPFDIRELVIEQASRGAVRIEGLRGDEQQTWIVGPDTSGNRSHPNFPESLLTVYREGQQLDRSGKLDQAAARWQTAALQAQESSSSPWLGVWLLSHAAQL